MQKQGLSTTRLKGLQGQITPKQVDDILQKTAQDTFKGDLGKAQAGTDAEAPQTLGQKYGGGDKPAGGTDQAAAPAKGGATIPANIQKALDGLNAQQKAELVKLL